MDGGFWNSHVAFGNAALVLCQEKVQIKYNQFSLFM